MTAALDTSGRPSENLLSLRPFFRPRSIAVVGASRREQSIGNRLLQTVIEGGFRGPIYPVNPHAQQVCGLPTYPSVLAIPHDIDLAIIATPRDAVLSVVAGCAARGVPALLVITAGFAEVGAQGAALQEQLQQMARAAGMRLIGPNCLGLLNTDPGVSLQATFVPVAVPRGHIAMSSDSGALGLALVAAAARLGLGISSCVSVGNRADVSSNDLLEYWADDPDTSLVVLYLESFGNPRNFARIAQRVSRSKPIIAMKAGRTSTGSRAAGSHTAALAATDVMVDALFQQTGILRVDTVEEMLDLTAALSMQTLPAGRRVAVLGNAGGPAILCADACEAGGLVLPELSAQTRRELSAFLPAGASLGNPVDMIASATAQQYHRAISCLLRCGEVDALIVQFIGAGADAPAAVKEAIGTAVAQAGVSIPVFTCLMADPSAPGWLPAGAGRIPCYRFPEEPARALGRMASYAEWRRQEPGRVPTFADMDLARARAICRGALSASGPNWLTTADARELLRAIGVRVTPGGVAVSADDAVELARQVGFPVVVKLASREILHKTERGVIHLGLSSEDDVRRAFEAIRSVLACEGLEGAMEGVLVQPVIRDATEVLVGVTHDKRFGPLVAFGLGGIHVEILGDVCYRVTPLTDRDASAMVRSIRGYRLLKGYRGHPPADIAEVEDILLRVSCLVEVVPEVAEIDLNPVFALAPGKGCLVADARIRVGRNQPGNKNGWPKG